jgi:hypothetical protein
MLGAPELAAQRLVGQPVAGIRGLQQKLELVAAE